MSEIGQLLISASLPRLDLDPEWVEIIQVDGGVETSVAVGRMKVEIFKALVTKLRIRHEVIKEVGCFCGEVFQAVRGARVIGTLEFEMFPVHDEATNSIRWYAVKPPGDKTHE